MTNINKKNGFTLVEISIVLIIISLLSAGVVGGSILVADAKLRNLMSEKTNLELAINSFKLKFDNLPGDMPNAYDVWGADCAATAYDCNGTGDGKVWWNQKTEVDGMAANDCPDSQEPLMQFVHLKLAGMIKGEYTGKCGDDFGNGSTIGEKSAYRSSISPAARWMASSAPEFSGWVLGPVPDAWLGCGAWFDFPTFYDVGSTLPEGRVAGNYVFTILAVGSAREVLEPAFPLAVQKFDIKFDDGLPMTGKVLGGNTTRSISPSNSESCRKYLENQYNKGGNCFLAIYSNF